MKLTPQQRQDFEHDGFLVINDVLDEASRKPLFDEYAQVVDEVAAKRGLLNDNWGSMSFEQRFTHLVANDPDAYEYLDITLPLKNDLTVDSGMHAGPAVFQLLTHPGILDIAESILGPEIVSNPVQHVRIKPPESALSAAGKGNSNMGRTGWHQDAAVVLEHAEVSPILTVWVAMTDATPEMGCMQAVAGSHQWKNLGKHCPGRMGKGEIYIPPTLVDDYPKVDLAVRAGGVVLLHKKTWHGAGPNLTENIRWSFDLRFQPPQYPTGRECFPEFLARSRAFPSDVMTSANVWQDEWQVARESIASGETKAIFNERWESNGEDPLCA
jgi:phytanoyl-CoA hydroxylase